MKRSVCLALCLALLLGLFAGCTPAAPVQPQAAEPPSQPQPVQQPAGIYTPGTYTATASGFGGEISVSITVDENNITACDIEGPGETPGVGANAVALLGSEIVAANSAEIDGISGATLSSNAIKKAALAAIQQAMGETTALPPVKMKAGTYTGYGTGYSRTAKLPVEVTVSETEITSIYINTTHHETYETSPILKSVDEKLVPRILQAQSISVDAICGATASSNGVKEALQQALAEALAAGGADPRAIENFYSVPAKVSGVVETLDTDVLVIGMGGAGIAAATSAAQNLYAANGNDASKVKVLALDKAGKYGGTSAITDEPMAINPPKFKKEYNNGKDYVDPKAMKAAWMAYTKGHAKEECLDIMMEESGETLDWLMYENGFFFGEPLTGFNPETDIWRSRFQYTGASGDTYHITATYFDSFISNFVKYGGEYMLETEGYELLYDQANNMVTGAKARRYDGTEYIINAKKVILATGGFGGNPDMLDEFIPKNTYYDFSSQGGWKLLGSYQNDGAGIRMALAIGAGTYNIAMSPQVHQCANPVFLNEFEIVPRDNGDTHRRTGMPLTWSINDIPLIMVNSRNVFSVDTKGQRFCNEAGTWQWWKAGPIFYSIWSDTQVKQVQEKGFDYVTVSSFLGLGGVPVGEPMPRIYEVLDAGMREGIVHKADTLADLAAQLGMDAATLEENVARYNGHCAAGEDPDFGKSAEYLYPLGDKGPYYAVTGASFCYGTNAGLDVDDHLRVLKTDGTTPIGGLYCAGTDCMGVLFTESEEYVTYGGGTQGWGYTSGRLAGKYAAAELSE